MTIRILAFVLCCFWVSSSQASPESNSYTVVDAAGIQHTFSTPPKIACVWYGCIESMAEMGLVPNAVSVGEPNISSVFYFPQGLPEHVIVDNANIEDWAKTGVDLVITRLPVTPEWRRFSEHIPIFYLHHPGYDTSDRTGFDAYLENNRLLASLAGQVELATAANNRFLQVIDNIKQLSTSEIKRQSVAIIGSTRSYDPLGAKTPFCAALKAAQAGACFSEGGVDQELNSESFLRWDPDWIVYEVDQSYKKRKDPIWKRLSAVRNGNIYNAKGNRYYCCSTRGLIHALQEFSHYGVSKQIPLPGDLTSFDPSKSPLVMNN